MSGCLRLSGWVNRDVIAKEYEVSFEVMKCSKIDCVNDYIHCEYTKNYRFLYFKCVNCVVCSISIRIKP